jgi:carbamoyltransferase
MRYIGFHIGHDASVAAIDESGELVFFGQVERYSRQKNHGFCLEAIGQSFLDMPVANEKDRLCMVANENYGDPKWRNCMNIASDTLGYDTRLVRPYRPWHPENFLKKTLGKSPDYTLNHHLAHAIAAWAYRPSDEERLFLVYDGAGHNAEGKLCCFLVGTISGKSFSLIESQYPIPTSVPLSGLLGYNSAGKAMGLAGYMPKKEFTLETAFSILQTALNDRYESCYPSVRQEDLTEKNMQMIADFYRWYTGEIWKSVEQNILTYGGDKGVVIGGGTTLALEINTKIQELSGEVVFCPATDDTGLALGAAAFAYFHENGKWPYLNSPSLNALNQPLPEFGPQSPSEIAAILASDEVVGLLRGKSEAGPRALGFRSLLALPKAENLKRVSRDIKRREFYRPLAPMITEEQFSTFFDGPKGEYMQYRVRCKESARIHLPAICHRDDSSRPQVVSAKKDPWLHDLLVEVGKRTGFECLINTSLNVAGKPICNNFDDVRREMRGFPVEFVSLPCKEWQPPTERLGRIMLG